MAKKKKNKAELDTETSFTDMNVEGLPWYDPKKKQEEDAPKKLSRPVSRKEYWRLVRATYLSWLPILGGILLLAGALFLICYLWLGL